MTTTAGGGVTTTSGVLSGLIMSDCCGGSQYVGEQILQQFVSTLKLHARCSTTRLNVLCDGEKMLVFEWIAALPVL